MIRLTFVTDQGTVGIVGINAENVLRMKAGMPLDINLNMMTPPGMQINRLVVHYAHTYEQVVDDIASGGLPVTEEYRQQARNLDARLKAEKQHRK